MTEPLQGVEVHHLGTQLPLIAIRCPTLAPALWPRLRHLVAVLGEPEEPLRGIAIGPKKVARCAAARTLLHLAWAVVTKGVACDPAYQPHQARSSSPV